ncbi:hypothetical protein DCAR_0727176 [Daucus carota subsp. sativus]|uniref:CoA carboxyltransferase N-terminal domain-containing protein n=1 Tax=Daucus carota subsp. sativus TaxID=79200 RepID=A0AAF0XGQ8_DAUCS|nr:hypothetical protein DCAR_0727176 [Daucus carota subsp. sativus]
MNLCEQCGYHLKMSSSNRIELSKDPDTWDEPYKDHIDSYQRKKGLMEAVQTGIGQLNGIPIALRVMDFQFMGVISLLPNPTLNITFAGKRVTEQTLNKTVPEGSRATDYLFLLGSTPSFL